VAYVTENPLNVIGKLDPELLKLAQDSGRAAFADGSLPKKTKLLIAMALDAAHGAVGGVRSLAQQAMEAGATKDEVAETLMVTNYVCGVGSVYTAAHALKDLL
jgi:alkylhydroperoxidase/carboxymuconolactone decarboxylase family protein YurZ